VTFFATTVDARSNRQLGERRVSLGDAEFLEQIGSVLEGKAAIDELFEHRRRDVELLTERRANDGRLDLGLRHATGERDIERCVP